MEGFMRFYNMGQNPFAKSLAPTDAFRGDDIAQVHARLDHLSRTGGIGLITADPGAGKTFAVRSWAAKANPNTTHVAYVCLSTVTNMEFYRLVCRELGLEPSFKKCDMHRDIQSHVRALADERHERVILILDEAHYLNSSILRDLQMLMNFDMDSRDLFALVLVGHTVLSQYISRQPYESLRQRLVVHYRLRGLDEAGTREYVRSRMLLAGSDPDIFDDAALMAAHGVSGGSIRRLNSIIVNALTMGAQNGLRSIDAELVRCASEELSLL